MAPQALFGLDAQRNVFQSKSFDSANTRQTGPAVAANFNKIGSDLENMNMEFIQNLQAQLQLQIAIQTKILMANGILPPVQSPVINKKISTDKTETSCCTPQSGSSETSSVQLFPDRDTESQDGLKKEKKRTYSKAFKPRLCSVEGCMTQDKGGGLCAKHGGGKPCAYKGCLKRVAGTKFCAAHGGTRKKRCSVPDCQKGDQGGGFCAAHGGGKRCKFEDCKKRAVGKGLCWSHGGGKRCVIDGCSRSPCCDGLCSKHLRGTVQQVKLI